jgi:hypothetical protein
LISRSQEQNQNQEQRPFAEVAFLCLLHPPTLWLQTLIVNNKSAVENQGNFP